MGKQKQLNSKEDEYLRGIIRQQRAEIKRLKRQLKQHEREKLTNAPQEIDDEPIPDKPDCPDCGKGFLSEFIFAGRLIKTCSICPYRSKAKKL